MNREAHVQDADYIECLPRPYRANYTRWRQRMLSNIDAVAVALQGQDIETVMVQYSLTRRDIALLVRLHYFTDDEVCRYNLSEIERSVPV